MTNKENILKSFKILDCTLRDGGYYTNWDFDGGLVTTYFKAFNELPVDYLEIGYRSNPMQFYFGEYFYCPLYVLEEAKILSNKKLAIILNEKDVGAGQVVKLLKPCLGLIDMVRIAIDPKNFKRALVLASSIKKMGFDVGFNVMYMSTWADQREFLDQIKEINGIADYFYMVDSFGGVYPEDVKKTYALIKEKTDVKIGFHGHNNLELALINTLTAIDCGVDIVDATVTGMGRGAGNLKTELLLTSLNSREGVTLNFNSLSRVVSAFESLQSDYRWGTNLPYMVSGANSLPQKDVMEWVTKRFYSFNSIIRALQNQKEKQKDNKKLEVFKPDKKYDSVIVIGGGPNAVNHVQAVKQFIQGKKNICIIHASSKNASHYKDLPVPQIFCLVGSEGHRLENVFECIGNFKGTCILPPFPRKMGTYIPSALENVSYELSKVNFTHRLTDSHTVLALQTALDLGVKSLYCVGYDGYLEGTITQLERGLAEENELLFGDFKCHSGIDLISLTPTNYKKLPVQSIYTFLL